MATIKEVVVPDIGTTKEVDVIEILVSPGSKIAKDDSLVTLESEKASMEVPSPYAGIVKEIKVVVGNKVKQGSPIVTMEIEAEPSQEAAKTKPAEKSAAEKPTPPKEAAEKPTATKEPLKEQPAATTQQIETSTAADVHAGPGVRRLARELGVDLHQVQGSGEKGRIQKEDIHTFVKRALQKSGGAGIAIAEAPAIDFAKFGEIEVQPLSKIKRFTGINVHRSWITVPHVTQFDEADITKLEAFRQANKEKAEEKGAKLTLLVFLLKAVVACLQRFPQFNASLDPSGEKLILKKYFHVGVAVDTPNGLVVPVLRDVDKKGFIDLAVELAKISSKAREKGLTPAEMQGSCFTISSLGGIGGTAFTPIVNTPDVAILGVSKAITKPIYHQRKFIPRLMLPLSLSYDHRVIDGAQGARFTTYLAELLADIRQLLM